jgi:hypothetical protein
MNINDSTTQSNVIEAAHRFRLDISTDDPLYQAQILNAEARRRLP